MIRGRFWPLAGALTFLFGAAFARADFRPGLQLWSIRAELKADPDAALDWVKKEGFVEIEPFDMTGTALSASKLSAMLRARGLRAVSAHFGLPRLENDLGGVIRDARALGVTYVICPIARPETGAFDAAYARRLAAEFNRFGRALKRAGLQFGYHPHGIEFAPVPGGSADTPFDLLVRRTDPGLVCFEMDVFWIVHAGQDPVRLLRKYPARWRLLHLKDMRRGAEIGAQNGHAPVGDFVAIGQGRIDWRAVLGEAASIGIKSSFIEDEGADPLRTIPESLDYLGRLGIRGRAAE